MRLQKISIFYLVAFFALLSSIGIFGLAHQMEQNLMNCIILQEFLIMDTIRAVF